MRNKMFFCFRWLLTISPVVFFHPVFAQNESEKGLPFITSYTSKTYNGAAVNWSAIQGDDGIMYFGQNNPGSNLSQYDGVRWRRIPSSATSIISRSQDKDKDGIIYYGGSQDFGYLDKDSIGKTREHSLLQYIAKEKRDFGDIWSVHAADNSIYFQSRERLFRLTKNSSGNNDTWSAKTWEPATHFMYSFYLDDVLYVHEQGVGLLKMIGDSLTLIPGSEFLGSNRMQVMLPYVNDSTQKNSSPQKQYLCGTFAQGFYLFDGKNFRSFKTELDSFKNQYTLYKGVRINGNYIFSYLGTGLVIMNPQGKIIQVINANLGLPGDVVYGIYPDSKGNLWLALDNGIAKVNINSPFTAFNSKNGIIATPLSIKRLPDGSLYVGTNNGLLKFNPSTSKFEVNTIIPRDQMFTLVADRNTLLVPTTGLYMIKNGKTILVQPSVNNNLKLAGLMVSKKYPDLMYGATTFGVCLFLRDPSKETGWQYLGSLPGIKDEMFFFAEQDNGSVWVCGNNVPTFRITPVFNEQGKPDIAKTRVESFGPGNNLDFPVAFTYALNHKIYFTRGDSATYTFNEKTGKFERAHFYQLNNFFAVADSTGKLWMNTGTTDNFKFIVATPKKDGSYQLDSNFLLPIIDRTTVNAVIYPDANGVVWFTGNDGLVRYDEKIKGKVDESYKVLIRDIQANKQELNPGLTADKSPEINHTSNSLRFEYAAPFYEQENKTQYQTWLEGFEKGWSDWGNNTYKEYTNLSSGKYTFHVRAKNLYHTISEESAYSFTVLPPWYNTWWAYVLYAIIFLFAGYLILNWRTKQLREKHAELEKIVEQRTHELSQRVAELAVINNVQEGLVSKLDMQSIYDLVGNKIRDAFDAQVLVIGSIDDSAGTEDFNYVIENNKRFYPASRSLDELRKQLIKTQQKIIIKNETEAIKWFGKKNGIEDSMPVKSAVFVPLIIGNKVNRYVSLQNVDKENAFNDSDVKLLETLANSMSVALENARLFDETNRLLKETEQRTAELAVINNVQDGLVREMDMQGIYDLVGDRLQQLFSAQGVIIANFNLDTRTEYFNYVFENGEKFDLESRPISNMRQQIIDKRHTIYIETEESARNEYGLVALGDTRMPKSLLFVPLLSGNEVKGYVSLQNIDTEHAFSTADIRLLETLANSMTVALQNARLFDETTVLLADAKQRASELATVNSVSKALASQLNPDELIQLVGDQMKDLFKANIVYVALLDKKQG